MADISKTAGDLAQRVAAHMTETFPATVDEGGWTAARDSRDGTAVVVWRPGYEPVQPQVRGMLLYRWLCSLRDAGAVAEARLDMAVFGRPDDESVDGIARWLHVTAWSAPGSEADAPLSPLPAAVPRRTVPLPSGHGLRCPLSGVVPGQVQFIYRPGGTETVLVYETADWSWGALETQPPAWLLEMAERHRPQAGAGTGAGQ